MEVTQRDLPHINDTRQSATPITVISSFRAHKQNVPTSISDAQTQAKLALLPSQPFILYVGDVNRIKGVYGLLDAYAGIATDVPLVLIGVTYADTPKVLPKNVILIDGLPHQGVMLAWERCLFGVAPSLWPEPFGSVIHEGMSKGKAMIGTTPGGHSDMIENEVSGLLVPGGDVPALRAALQRLLDDAALRDRLGAAAKDAASRFTSEHSVPRWIALLNDSLQFARQRTAR